MALTLSLHEGGRLLTKACFRGGLAIGFGRWWSTTDVGWNLLIFLVKTKTEKTSKIILEQHRLIRRLPVCRQ